jgi:hypothetical protein
MRNLHSIFVTAIGLGLLAGSAAAGPINLTVSGTGTYPGNARPVTITIGTFSVEPVLLPPRTSASTKASQIYGALVGLPLVPGFPYPNMTVTYTTPNNFVTIGGLPNGTVVRFSPNMTGERPDRMTASLDVGEQGIATVGFENPAFAALDGDGNDSLFTAGIVTPDGVLDATIDSSVLPNLDGATIAQALYNDLAPSLSSFGAQIINYHPGDEDLTFLFNLPGVNGIDFGTTAETGGSFGQIVVTPEPSVGWLTLLGVLAVGASRARRARGLLPE